MRLKDKVCLITGAARGIGRSICERFLAEGAEVIATDRDDAALNELLSHPRLRRRALDVTSSADITKAATAGQDIDVLVNCAGYVATGTILS